MSFDELIALLREPGDNEIPATIYDDLLNLHAESLNDIEKFGALVNEKDSRIAELEGQVSELKFRIAELEGEDDSVDSDSNSDTDNSTISIDDLFEGDK